MWRRLSPSRARVSCPAIKTNSRRRRSTIWWRIFRAWEKLNESGEIFSLRGAPGWAGGVLGARLESAAQDVTYDQILHSASHAEDWLTYGGNYASQRFSELQQ